MSRIILVDEDDNEIGLRDRSAIEPHDIYRVTGLWITNPKGEVLISKRSLTKQKNPGRWSCAVAGHVDEGETYESNILKEAEEELGLKLSAGDLRAGPKLKFTGTNTFWVTWYFATLDLDIRDLILQEDEVSEVRWISVADLRKEVKEHPEHFTHGLVEWIETLSEGLETPSV